MFEWQNSNSEVHINVSFQENENKTGIDNLKQWSDETKLRISKTYLHHFKRIFCPIYCYIICQLPLSDSRVEHDDVKEFYLVAHVYLMTRRRYVPYWFTHGFSRIFWEFFRREMTCEVTCTQDEIEPKQGENQMNISKLKITFWEEVTTSDHLSSSLRLATKTEHH